MRREYFDKGSSPSKELELHSSLSLTILVKLNVVENLCVGSYRYSWLHGGTFWKDDSLPNKPVHGGEVLAGNTSNRNDYCA